jgi:hypothetical protein
LEAPGSLVFVVLCAALSSVACRGASSRSIDDASARESWLDRDFSAELDPEWITVREAPAPPSFREALDALWPPPAGSPVARSGSSGNLQAMMKEAFSDGLPDPGDTTWSAVEVAAADPRTHTVVTRPEHAFAAPDAPIPVALGWNGVVRRLARLVGAADPGGDAARSRFYACTLFDAFARQWLEPRACSMTPVVYLARVGANEQATGLLEAAQKEQDAFSGMAGAQPSVLTWEWARQVALDDWLIGEMNEAYDAFVRGDAAFALATGTMVLARRPHLGDAGIAVDGRTAPFRAMLADAARRRRAAPAGRSPSPRSTLRNLEDVAQVRWADSAHGCRLEFGDDPYFREVVTVGQPVIPGLIASAERDQRLTRAVALKSGSCPTKLVRVADAAFAALDAFLERRAAEAGHVYFADPSDGDAGIPKALAVRRLLDAAAVPLP